MTESLWNKKENYKIVQKAGGEVKHFFLDSAQT